MLPLSRVGFPGGASGKHPPANAADRKRHGSNAADRKRHGSNAADRKRHGSNAADRKRHGSNAAGRKRHGLNPWVGKIPSRRKWQPTPVFLLGKSHGQRSLAGCGPQGCKESDTTEAT